MQETQIYPHTLFMNIVVSKASYHTNCALAILVASACSGILSRKYGQMYRHQLVAMTSHLPRSGDRM